MATSAWEDFTFKTEPKLYDFGHNLYKTFLNEVVEASLKYCITITSAARTQWIKEKILMKSQLDAQQKPGI